MSKDNRLAYFKDNYQDPTDDEFDPTQYYYKRPERTNGDLGAEFDGLVGGLGAYDTTGLGLGTNPTGTGPYTSTRFPFISILNTKIDRFGMGQLSTGGMGINMPMYSQQSQLPQTQLNNSLSSLSRVMMQQPQNATNPTTSRMRMTSPIRNATPNSSMMMNGPMGHPMEQAYRTQTDSMMGMMNSNEMYQPPSSQSQMFSRTTDVRTQQLLMQQQLALEQQRLLAQQQQPTTSSSLPSDSKYGLLGLRNVIKMTDQDLNVLALGFDLTTLGLNLNSPEYLYRYVIYFY
jgi:hypothetical protein